MPRRRRQAVVPLYDVLERLGLLTRVRGACPSYSPQKDIWPDLAVYAVGHKAMRSTLGSCDVRHRIIQLDSALWRQADSADGRRALVEVLLHETAHAMSHLAHGTVRDRAGRRQIHGPKWREAMRSVGVSPSRCASGETTRIARQGRPAPLRGKRRTRRRRPAAAAGERREGARRTLVSRLRRFVSDWLPPH